jgi:hypothetical protein
MFVAFKEDLTEGERHIGAVKFFRFYFKCIHYFVEIAVKTNLENFDYMVEADAIHERSIVTEHLHSSINP